MAEPAVNVPAPATKKKAPAQPAQKFVTLEQFNALESSIGKLVDLVTTKMAPAIPQTPEQVKKEAEIVAAKPDENLVNPAWIAKANEIIGEAVDHCEVLYPKHGGTIFTVVIKTEMSNAQEEYLSRHKQDRRSREIGNEGIGGVEEWCKLIAANLKRSR